MPSPTQKMNKMASKQFDLTDNNNDLGKYEIFYS